MPMLHMAGLGCGCGMGDATMPGPPVPGPTLAPLPDPTLAPLDVASMTDQEAYYYTQYGNPGSLPSDKLAILNQKSVNYTMTHNMNPLAVAEVNAWTDKQAYDYLQSEAGKVAGDLPPADTQAIIVSKAATYSAVQVQTGELLSGAADLLRQNWVLALAVAAGVVYLMFKSKSEG